MSEIQHKSLEEEILYVIGRSSAPLTSGAIYERCDLADEMAQVSKAIFQLQSDGKIERFAGPGRQRYKLADGVAAPAPAGKTGRSKAVRANDAARSAPLTGVRPAPESGPPVLDIPKLGDQLPEAPSPVDDETAKGLDLVERQLANESLADAIIARLKRQLAPTLCELEAAAGLDRMSVHIHIEQVDFHLGGL